VAADAVWLYGHVTGTVAASVLKRSAGTELSETSLWRRVETRGTRLQTYERAQHATANALPIGCGMIESGCKQIGARFNGAGMRWSREGAERLIPIRAAILSGRFDEVWHVAYNSPLN
jgi:hypothetical protein